MKKLVELCTKNSLLVNLVTVAIIVAGGLYLMSINREAFPKVEFDWVVVETIYPGATPADVEKHISIPLEDELREVNGIEKVVSSSLENMSIISIQLDPNFEEDRNKVINDIRSSIDRYNDFPDDVEDPVVVELSVMQTPVISISLTDKNGVKSDKDEFELRRYAKILKEQLQDIRGVARVNYDGYRDREMIVEVNPDLLDKYHIAINEVVQALSQKNINFPGGTSKKNNEEVLIRTIGEVETASEISQINIRSNDQGNWVKIGNVATVKDSFEEEVYINKVNGTSSITLTVLKKEAYDIIKVVDKAMKISKRFKKTIPENYDLVYTDDFSYYVKRRLNVLLNNGYIGFILVIITLLMAFGWRISLVTAIGLPLAFAGTFIWMGFQGITVNLISMFGLIMVLGMLVDDAIIVAENIYRHLEEGATIKEAVVNGTGEVIIPVAGTIMTTIAAFAPLLFMTGIMGKFIWVLPAVVSIALIGSWIESMFILPSHIHDIEKRRKHVHAGKIEGGVSRLNLRKRYVKILNFVLHHKLVFSILITLFFLGSIMFAGKNLKFILFPAGGIETIIIKAESDTGTSVQQMSKKLVEIEKIVDSLPGDILDSHFSRAGIIQQDPNDPQTKRGSNYGMLKVFLKPSQGRKLTGQQVVDILREKSNKIASSFRKIEFDMIKGGPPSGKPISVDVKGDDYEVLSSISQEIKDYLKTIKGVKDIQDNYEEKKKELRIFLDEKMASIAGVTVYDVAQTVRSCYEGTVATEIKKTDEEIDIRVVLPEKLKDSLSTLKQIKVANKMGNLIPLTRVAKYYWGEGVSRINRKDWRRTITVEADIEAGAKVDSLKVNFMIKNKFKDMDKKYPGYILSYEGEFKDTEESMEDLGRSFIIAVLVIYIILVWLFRTLHHPLIVMGVIPLTLVGVIWAFFIHGMPLSFMAMMGVVGLIGVVVNDSIVFVEFINNSTKTGKTVMEATLEAGSKRLRPILLTSMTTIFGLLPTTYGWGGMDPFLVPMALAMSWGLAFGTFITLFATPILYNMFYSLIYILKNKLVRKSKV